VICDLHARMFGVRPCYCCCCCCFRLSDAEVKVYMPGLVERCGQPTPQMKAECRWVGSPAVLCHCWLCSNCLLCRTSGLYCPLAASICSERSPLVVQLPQAWCRATLLLLLLLPLVSPWCVVVLVCRDLMRRVSSLYPATKVISFIQEGLNSKNNR
jgi:hypothetical protein